MRKKNQTTYGRRFFRRRDAAKIIAAMVKEEG